MSNSVSQALARQSAKLLHQHKKLLFFMTLSTLLSIGLLLLILPPFIQFETLAFSGKATITPWHFTKMLVLILFLFYMLNLFQLSFSAALTRCVLDLFLQKPLKLWDGLRTLFKTLCRLAIWQVTGNAYAVYLRLMCYWVDDFDRSAVPTKILASLHWHVAMQFFFPILVEENYSPHNALQSSAHLISNTWLKDKTKTLKSQSKLGRKKTIVILILFIMLVLTVLLSHTPINIVSTIIITGCAIGIIGITIYATTLQVILTTAAYCFAKKIDTSRYYDQTLLSQSFREITKHTPN